MGVAWCQRCKRLNMTKRNKEWEYHGISWDSMGFHGGFMGISWDFMATSLDFHEIL
jgi:hypothetical protein